jgi:hypothetical protein
MWEQENIPYTVRKKRQAFFDNIGSQKAGKHSLGKVAYFDSLGRTSLRLVCFVLNRLQTRHVSNAALARDPFVLQTLCFSANFTGM